MNIAKSHIKMTRISARKARLVADLVRNKNVTDSIAILENTDKKAAPLFMKLLNSAIANAVNNHGMNGEKLFIHRIFVDEGPTLKRFQPRSQGRAYPIFKRTSKMTIEVVER